MAASITTSASTIEGQALEVASKLQELEAATPEAGNRVGIAPDIENNQVTITMVLPTAFASSGGAFSMTATEYLS